MTKKMTPLDVARKDAQELHKKISATIDRAQAATWAEVRAMQADAASLMAKMKTITDTEIGALKADLTAAMAKLDATAKLVDDKAAIGKDAVKHANTALLAASRAAAQSLSHAVANMRSKAAKAIEPKKVSA